MKGATLALAVLFGTGLWAHNENAARTANTPSEMAQRQTDHLTKFFNLTSNQQSEVKGILTSADKKAFSVRDQIRPLRQNLTAEIKANEPNQIRATLHEMMPLQEKVESIHAVAAGQIYANVLDPAQQGQLQNGLWPLLWPGAANHAQTPYHESAYSSNQGSRAYQQSAYVDAGPCAYCDDSVYAQ
jgi:hypothetical protein